MPCVSVVIPLYNKEPYIKRAIDSVLAQTVNNFELIVVDDGSTDMSANVVKSISDKRIRLIQQKNLGVSAARNRGIEESNADLIAFLDADDEWFPTFLETICFLRQKYPQAGAYATAYKYELNEKEFKLYDFQKGQRDGLITSYFKSAAITDGIISSSTVTVPKNIFIEIGKFPVGEWWGEDTDMWGRIALKYPIAFSSDCNAIYHSEASNRACEKIKPVKKHIFVTSALKALQNGDVSTEIEADLLNYIATKEIQTACRNLKAGRPDLAKSNLYNLKIKGYKMRWKYYEAFLWAHVPSNMFLFLRSLKYKIKNIIR
jgi:glycosyltransferase involved in cell wall biosynthesis